MLKALSLAKTQLKEFQKATGQHCCSSQHDGQIETTNITLFVEVEALGISLHLQLELSEQAAAHYSTAPHPGEQRVSLGPGQQAAPAASPGTQQDVRTPNTQQELHCPPATPGHSWHGQSITARVVFKHLLSGWTGNLTTKVAPQNQGGQNNQFPSTQLKQMSNIC